MGWGMTEGKAVGKCRHPHPQSSDTMTNLQRRDIELIKTSALNGNR